MGPMFKAALITLPVSMVWIYFWTNVIKFKNKNDRIVSAAKDAGRYATAHFVELRAGFICVYEYEADGRMFQWKHAITPNATQRSRKASTAYTKNDFPDRTIYWPAGHPEKADFDGSFGRGMMAAIIQFAPVILYLVLLGQFQ